MRQVVRSSVQRRMRLAWITLALMLLVVSALQPGLLLRPVLAQGDGTPAADSDQGVVATQEPVDVAPATAIVAFRVVDAKDQPIVDGYRLCVDGGQCVDILEGRAYLDGLAAGAHTYEITWKWDGDGPFERKLDTFWVDPSIGENAVRIELTPAAVFEPAVEPLVTLDVPSPTATDAVVPTATETTIPATVVPSPSATIAIPTATATTTGTSTPSATIAESATSTGTAETTPSATISPSPTAATATISVSPSSTVVPTQTSTSAPTSSPTRTLTPTITPTLAPVSGKVTGTGGAGVNCRTQPSTSSAIITVLHEGDTAIYRDSAANGWQPVTCAGRAGYISATYLTGIPVTPTATPRPTGTATPTRTPTPTRTVTGTATTIGTSTVTGTVSATTTTTTTTTGTVTGTVSPTTTGTTTATATVAPTGTPIAGGKVTGTGGVGVNCRRSPSTSGVIITTVPEGTVLPYRGAASAGWQPVTCAGQAGFISTTYLAGTTITPTPVRTPGSSPTATATTTPSPGTSGVITGTDGGGLNCRLQPNSSSAVITIIPEGSIVQFRGVAANGWQPVTCAGQAGFISTAYLTGISGATGELWVDVNLSTQYMIVYRGNTRVLGTYVSTGRPGFDTPTGTYRVNTKLVSQTMSGVLGGEYYNVPNVPWVMYFTDRGHAIHGTYWHNNFGHTMSHGCINLPLDVAAWLYAQAPIGMRVVIHY